MRESINIILAILIIAIANGIVSCSNEDDRPKLEVNTNEGTVFSIDGGTISISVTSDATWRIDRIPSEKSDWLSTYVSQGKGNLDIIVKADANNTIYSREATLRFVCTTNENISQSLTFSQAGLGTKLEVNVDEGTEFSINGGSIDVSVTSDTKWRIDRNTGEDSNWLSTDVSQGKGNKNVKVTAKANNSIYIREATLCFVCTADESISQTLTFRQAGAEPKLIVTPNTINLTPYENSLTLKIESNMAWTTSPDYDWLTLSATSGQGSASLTMKISENSEKDDRKAVVTFISEDNQLSQQVEISQEGMSSQLYREPFVKWGVTKEDVKSYMDAFNIVEDNDKHISYNGKYSEVFTGYSFDNGQLWNAVVALNSLAVESDALKRQMQKNNYMPSGLTTGGIPVYVSSDRKTVTLLDDVTEPQAYFVRYFDYGLPFKAPYTSWLSTISGVKANMSKNGYEIAEEGTTTSGHYIVYYGKRLESYSIYYFNTLLQLNEVDVFLDPNIVSFKMVGEHLKSALSYVSTTNLTSNYGTIYESRDNKTVVLVIHPDLNPNHTDVKIIQAAFMSLSDVYSFAGGNSRNMTRSDISNLTLDIINRQPSELPRRMVKQGFQKR